MEKFVSKKAKCPFYDHEYKCHVVCLGWLRDTTLALRFGDREDSRLFRAGYCHDVHGFLECPVYIMLAKEAEENEY